MPFCLAFAFVVVARLQARPAPTTATPESAPLSIRLDQAPDVKRTEPVVCWSETQSKPRPLRIHCLRIDLHDPRIEPCVILGADPDGPGPAEATLTKPVELAHSEPGLLAAVNANAFAHLPDTTATERKRGWFAGKAVDIHGLAAADGEIRSPSAGGRTNFWFDPHGRPHLGEVAEVSTIHHGVADWGSLLVKDGRIMANPDTALHPRTLAGFDATHRWLWLVVIDGRQRGVSEGATLTECAALMAARGCANVVNLDGGGSSIMLHKETAKPGPTTINRPSDGAPRAIPVMLGIRRKES